MEETKLRQIWTWFRSQLDVRLATNIAVGAVLGLLAFEAVKLVITLVVAVVGFLTVMLFKAY